MISNISPLKGIGNNIDFMINNTVMGIMQNHIVKIHIKLTILLNRHFKDRIHIVNRVQIHTTTIFQAISSKIINLPNHKLGKSM